MHFKELIDLIDSSPLELHRKSADAARIPFFASLAKLGETLLIVLPKTRRWTFLSICPRTYICSKLPFLLARLRWDEVPDEEMYVNGNFRAAMKVSALIRSLRKGPRRYIRRRSREEVRKLVAMALHMWRTREEEGMVEWTGTGTLRIRISPN